MPNLFRIVVIIALSVNVCTSFGRPIDGQSLDSKSPSGSISGRVTLNGKPVPGVLVILTRNAFDAEDKPVAKITTDQDGRFRIANVPGGSFNLSAFAPAFVFDDTSFGQDGKRMTISPGEAIEGVEISLKRGGVITGRVSDSAGRPVIEERMTLTMIDEQGRQQGSHPIVGQDSQTDDRGVYRIFGVREGRYIVSIGEPPNQGGSVVRGNTYYPMTFHPGVTDASMAAVIELAAGAESTGIDIVLGRAAKAYTATGRIVDAETGKPVPNVSYGYGILYDRRGISTMACCSRSDAQGSFRIERLPPGHYAAFIVKDNDTEHYSDITSFDVIDADVSALEIKVRRGSSISGVAVIDGLPDGGAAEKLSGLSIRAFVQSSELGAPSFGSPPNIAPDGSFRITGLRAGKVKLSIGGNPVPKGFALSRVERDGVEQRDASFDIAAGEQLSGVRIIIAYGTAVIRGQLKITGEAVRVGTTFAVRLKREGADSSRRDWLTYVDDRNRFLFEALPPGDYEVIVSGYIAVPGAPASRVLEMTKRVTVTNDGEAEITIVIDLGAKNN